MYTLPFLLACAWQYMKRDAGTRCSQVDTHAWSHKTHSETSTWGTRIQSGAQLGDQLTNLLTLKSPSETKRPWGSTETHKQHETESGASRPMAVRGGRVFDVKGKH